MRVGAVAGWISWLKFGSWLPLTCGRLKQYKTPHSMSKGDQKEVRLEIRLPRTGYPRTMFFNRIRLEREPEFCVVHFGFVSDSRGAVDQFACVLPKEALKNNEKSLLDYLERIGQAEAKSPPAWQPVRRDGDIEVADIVGMAHRNDLAETCLYAFSMTAATRLKPGTSSHQVEAQPLILLRSTVELQKQLIAALYEE